jgi:hypothetical protein
MLLRAVLINSYKTRFREMPSENDCYDKLFPKCYSLSPQFIKLVICLELEKVKTYSGLG